jgi:hypothetical protein
MNAGRRAGKIFIDPGMPPAHHGMKLRANAPAFDGRPAAHVSPLKDFDDSLSVMTSRSRVASGGVLQEADAESYNSTGNGSSEPL